MKAGYAPSTINSYLSVNNAYLDFVGHREYQLANQLKLETELQPELTRTGFLRLLQTARTLGREKVYLLVKLFGTTGLTVQELEKVTVEAVKEGKPSSPPRSDGGRCFVVWHIFAAYGRACPVTGWYVFSLSARCPPGLPGSPPRLCISPPTHEYPWHRWFR